jgi:hypothetical protein
MPTGDQLTHSVYSLRIKLAIILTSVLVPVALQPKAAQ